MSRTEMHRLLAACKADPHDGSARLVLADWLEEHGGAADRARARLIRLQVPAPRFAARPDLRGEQTALALEHQSAWDGDAEPLLKQCDHLREREHGLCRIEIPARALGQKRWHRLAGSEGWAWVEQVRVAPTAAVLASPLLASVPRLYLDGERGTAQWRRIAASSALAWPRALILDHGDVPDAALEALVSSRHLEGLRELSLFPADPSGPGLACLEGRLPALDTLNLCGIPAGDLSPEELARVLARPALRELDLRTTSLTTPHVRMLSDRLPGLRKLWISRVRRSGTAFDLADAAFAAGLDFLMLHEYPMNVAGYRKLGRLAEGRLRVLLLWEMGMKEAQLRALASAGTLGRLTHLDINRNRFGVEGARALARSGQQAPLSLDVSSCALDDDAANALAGWPGLARCRVLDVSDNQLSAKGLRALCESPHLTALLELNVSQQAAGSGLAGVLRSPVMGRLESLKATGLRGDAARMIRSGPERPLLRNLALGGPDGLLDAVREKCPNAFLE